MHDVGCPRKMAKPYENTTRTAAGQAHPAICAYVAATAWRYGAGGPFCGAPALPGSSYCAPHHALCALVAGSAEAAGAARAQADAGGEPPPGLISRALIRHELPLPLEVDADEDPRELAACLDLPARAAAAEEG